MPDDQAPDLLALAEAARARVAGDPFGNPVLATSLAVLDAMDAGALTLAGLETAVRALRDAALADRAARLARYVGGTDPEAAREEMERLAARLVRPDPDDSPVPWARFREEAERPRFAAVFTAHPTFALPPAIYAELAEAASGRPPSSCAISHRPARPTLSDEFEAAAAAIARGRDALDVLCGALLDAGRAAWPDRWSTLAPHPVILASWVGYDTDGRTDIGWWDSLRLRLRMKRLGLARLADQLAAARPRRRSPERRSLGDAAGGAPEAPSGDARPPTRHGAAAADADGRRRAGSGRRAGRRPPWPPCARGSRTRWRRWTRRSPPPPRAPTRRRWRASLPCWSAATSGR